MKKICYDLLNNGGKRTYNNFMTSFYQILTQKCFEEISVAEFCQFAKYPRATFYNYFDDKYELLECFWEWSFKRSVSFTYNADLERNELIKKLFELSYRSIEEKEVSLKRMMKLNLADAYFISSLDFYIKRKIEAFIKKSNIAEGVNLPMNLLIDHVSSSIFIIVNNRFIKGENWSLEETYNYFIKVLY